MIYIIFTEIKSLIIIYTCTALVVGCDDVASCYSVGVLTRRQVGRWEGSREVCNCQERENHQVYKSS